MSIPYDELLSDFTTAGSVEDEAIQSAESETGITFPTDYKRFLRVTGGGEGFIGKHYLIVWRPEEIAEFNRDYQVAEQAPGLLIFASNGGGEAFAFDTRVSPYKVVQVPFIGMSLEDAVVVSLNYDGLLERMLKQDGSLLKSAT